MERLRQSVAIFWDFENCALHSSAGGWEVDNIRRIAQEYGAIKIFKAYLEISSQSSPKTLNLRSELQSCGVSLTDCPHNGRKDVADKMMLVDMLTFALDTEAPATIVLLSGDRDFVYALSVLRLRSYHTVVIAPKQAHPKFNFRASEVLDW
ncbi:limkain-b1-type NYN domain-containing protein, partial [Irpex rosettiformis]